MYLENFHKQLKGRYMEGRFNKRVDKCTSFLLTYVRDSAFDRLIKQQRGKVTKRIADIRNSHAASLKLHSDSITETDGSWKVVSSDGKSICMITKMNEQCKFQNCQLVCRPCGSSIWHIHLRMSRQHHVRKHVQTHTSTLQTSSS